jgi:thioesterase domain-containing protein
LCAELQATWRDEIPLAAAIQLEVVEFAGGQLTVRAPLAPNRNVHGTAFAGSLYSVCVLTAWGRLWMALRERGLQGRVVVADSRIAYRKAVTGELVCRCTADPSLDDLAATGRAQLTVTSTIDGATAPAVEFEGTYVIVAKRPK